MNPVNTTPYVLPSDALWLITGCSSGIGRELASLIASKPEHRLVATARNISTLSYLPNESRILITALDVTSPDSVKAAFTAVAEHFGKDFHLDVCVNNAGYSLSGDTEAAQEQETHDEIETLFFGTARVTTRAIENMRQSQDRRGGLIFNISSLAGVCAFPGHAYYHAGKFAVEGWTESVAREMHKDWNIHFCIIEPGGVKTNFDGHSKAHIEPHPAYAGKEMPARILEFYVQKGLESGIGLIQPATVAETIYKVASRGERVPLRLPLGLTAWSMIKQKLQTSLNELEEVKELSALGQQPPAPPPS